MILLILALFISLILIRLIYNKLNNESSSLISMSIEPMANSLATKEHNMLKDTSSYYNIRAQGPGSGLLITKPGINDWIKYKDLKDPKTKQIVRGGENQPLTQLKKFTPKVSNDATKIDRQVADCRSLESCDDLNGKTCGYCYTTNTFSYGDKKGSKTDACPDAPGGIKAWSMEANACKKIKERATCSAVKDCGSLMGDSAQMCGYCPTTGRIMAKQKKGNKNVPKYAEDKCPGPWGLLDADKCMSFARDNPCITPNWETGPHSEECIKKLYKNSKCTKQPPMDKAYSWWTTLQKHYKNIGNDFLDTFNKTKDNNYDIAKHNNIKCYGNTSRLKACDKKYMKNEYVWGKGLMKIHPKECYEQKYKKSGCTEKGDGWKDIQNNLHLGILKGTRKKHLFGVDTTNDNYMDKFKKLSETATTSNDYETKKAAAMECYGEIPPPPPPVKVGDLIAIYINLESADVGDKYFLQSKCEFRGIITEDLGKNYCNVMWIYIHDRNNKNNKFERRNASMEEQKKYFGWPGIPPTLYSDLLPAKVPKSKLKTRKTCLTGKSACKPSCNDIINNVLFKYPKPRDCIVSDWGGYSRCTKNCGTGSQYRTREILYHPRRGGASCPTLKETRVCNTQSCINPNFKEARTIKNTIGRYIRIEGVNTYIHVQEIEVYDHRNVNIARGLRYPRVTQSSQGWSGHPNYITDGDKRWRRWPNSNHTHRGGRQWVQIDLGSDKKISRIVVYNRPDCCRGRLNGCKLFINNAANVRVSKKMTLTSSRTQTFYSDGWQLNR